MEPYCTWTRYAKLFPNGMGQREFEALLPEAEAYIDVATNFRAQTVDGALRDRVETAAAMLVDMIGRKRRSGAADFTQEEDMDGRILRMADRLLSGTGLTVAL